MVSFSVIIPLYNKEQEIEGAILSALAQSFLPREIIVVDDGSTDNSLQVVKAIDSPLVRVITQKNAGVSAARNRAMAEATGNYFAFLDGDDRWQEDFLAEIASLICEFPLCGLYSTAFDVVSKQGIFPAPTPQVRGVVENFFRDSLHQYISIPSASCVPRSAIDDVGGFPDGMKIGEDLYLWIKIATKYLVAFSPRRLSLYSKQASNRSATIYTPERTKHSFYELYTDDSSPERKEFIARAALGKALILSIKGDTNEARQTAQFFAYTTSYRSTLCKVRILNALPKAWRAPIMHLYNTLAWRIAKKGL